MGSATNINLLDIIGPVMIGPSSSHTAGACRIGYIARKILAEKPIRASIGLCGSFAETYKGHGTDKALVAGILGMRPDDERLPDSMKIAEEEGMAVVFETLTLPNRHPNTAVINLIGENGNIVDIEGASVGGGKIMISKLDGMESIFDGHCDTLIIPHNDTNGVIATVTQVLALYNINIGNFRLTKAPKDHIAIMTIEVDGRIQDEAVELLRKQPNIIHVTCLNSEVHLT